MKMSRGFTLIEIVVVIVLIGILSAVALPRFYDFTEDATEAAAKGVVGAINSSVSMANGAWLSRGKPATIDGMLMDPRTGVPVGVGSQVPSALDASQCASLLSKMLSDTSTVAQNYQVHSGGSAVGAAAGDGDDGNRCYWVNKSVNNGNPIAGSSFVAVVYDRAAGKASVANLAMPAAEAE